MIDEELKQTKTTLRDLVASRLPEETKRLNLFRALAFREQVLERAVRDDKINPEEDGVFSLFVKKQVKLTKIVHGE